MSLEFYLNGKLETVADCDPSMTLLDFLRRKKGLTGTKLGCGEGGCGACTVVVSNKTVNSCLTPLCAVDGQEVTTVEGIGTAQTPHIVQKTIADSHGSQCGFCTPGFVMSLYNKKQQGDLKDIESCYDGNLCRCTGYRPLLDAAKSVLSYEEEEEKEEKVKVCGYKQKESKRIVGKTETEREQVVWHKPLSMKELLLIKRENPDCKVIGGNTEVGIEVRFKHNRHESMVYIGEVEELKQLKVDPDTLELSIGGGVTLTALKVFLEAEIRKVKNTSKEYMVRGFESMVAMLKWFASTQIRNMATLAGNIVTASPISDMNPVLMGLGAQLVLRSATTNGSRVVNMREFFLSYRKVDMEKDEVVETIIVPPVKSELEFVACYKQARRREDDISIVNACFRVELDTSGKVEDISMCYGGVAPTSITAKQSEMVVKGAKWGEEMLEEALDSLAKEINLPDGVPGGMAKYRSSLVLSFFYKFYITTSLELKDSAVTVDMKEMSAARTFLTEEHKDIISTQGYPVYEGGLQATNISGSRDHEPTKAKERSPVGDPLKHRSALTQCTGEAKYIDDIPEVANTLHAAFLLSTKPHAQLLNIDTSKAEAVPGFVSFLSAKDMAPENNLLGPVAKDEQVFRADTVTSTGQPIGVVLAESHKAALEAVRHIKVEYKELPAIITINEARVAKSFHSEVHEIKDGDVASALSDPEVVVVEGEMAMAGQEHFYLETNASYAVPGEDGEIMVYASTQNPDKTQAFVASACGVSKNRVVCRMKRMGGAFGGKETRSVFISAAVGFAAHKLKRPVKMVLERDVDMWITGTRHPFVGTYRAGATKDGKLVGIECDFYSNIGYSLDLSGSVMDRALFHIDNAYNIPNTRTRGYMCVTNTTTNTAFRGFGGPQGMLVCEAAIAHLASELKMPADAIRGRNLYRAGDVTHYGQKLLECPLERMWKEIMVSCDYDRRCSQVEKFNKENRWRKRGIAIVPTKFGINFTAKFLNQAGALVHVYTDGTVLIAHGGTEMGQGLHTKIVQVAAREFGIPVTDVHISETATDKVPNTSPTAASASSDIYGMAVLHACEQINQRLAPIRAEAKGSSFKEIVASAYFARIDLSAHGFYKTPFVGYNFDDGKPGEPFNYFTHGVACTEVEIDVLTGDSRALRADIVMDLGSSLNPAIDVGQIEGGFTQGYGWCMMEEPVWGYSDLPWIKNGDCFTRGPGTYKIPSSDDVPIEFHIQLLKDSPNPKAIHSSRAVGEPPFFLGTSAFFATQNAIASARQDAGASSVYVHIDSPMSSERIRMACADKLTNRVCEDGYKPNGFI